MAGKVAVIAGATGAAAKRLVEVLLADPDWRVVGLSRHPRASDNPRLKFMAADLTDAANIGAALGKVAEATHVFYTARVTFTDASKGVEDVEGNAAMLRNLVDAAEAFCQGPAACASGRGNQVVRHAPRPDEDAGAGG
ncbi:MAG: NAD(P)H-binding protein [Hyphomicrobiaceae bacterium]